MPQQAFTVEQRAASSIRPYENNPRRNQRAVAKVKASIAEFGFRQPIVVDEDGVIIIGHTRFAAAQELGMATVPVHVARGLSPQQVRALRIADNRTAEEAEWDWGKLVAELRGMGTGDVDELERLTAFDSHELDPLLETTWEPVPVDDLPDAHQPRHHVTFTAAQWATLTARLEEAGGEDMAAFLVSLVEGA